MNISKKEKLIYLLILVSVIGLDLYTKSYISSHMLVGDSIKIIPQFFNITYVLNTGAAWGMFSGGRYMFLAISIVAGIFMIYYFKKVNKNQFLTKVGLVLLFAGMLGNLYDRLFLHHVRDFLDFIIFRYDFPVFNVADMGVTIGMFLIIVEMIIGEVRNGSYKDNSK